MLEKAIAANLPLVSVHTDDPYYIKDVLEHCTGVPPVEWKDAKAQNLVGMAQHGNVAYTYSPPNNYLGMYGLLKQKEVTLVLVNVEEEDPMVFQAGEVTVPLPLLRKFLKSHLEGPVEDIAAMLRGLSLKEVYEIVSLASAEYHELTPESVSKARRMHMSNRTGLIQVDTELEFYEIDTDVEEWLDVNAWAFAKQDLHRSLVPRGLLFDGPPGTGKTMAAKHIADSLKVPLFNLNLGSLMDKWVGSSESNLRATLAAVDRAAPCVILIDEVEKVLTTGDDSGVATRMLSTLLWWMQEHTSRVLTLMTTNDQSKIPPELYRPGRIDEIVHFSTVGFSEAQEFFTGLAEFYGLIYPELDSKEVAKDVLYDVGQAAYGDEKITYTYAELTSLVVGYVKGRLSAIDNQQPGG